MTGFVALAGALSGERQKSSALLKVSGYRDETLHIAFADDRLTFLMTADLACLKDPGDGSVSVGDVLGAFSNLEESLAVRRRRSLAELLNAERAANGRAPPHADEYHVLTWRPEAGQLEARHDWAGVKPLYFIQKPDGVVIASALRLIVELSDHLELDEGVVAPFRRWSTARTGQNLLPRCGTPAAPGISWSGTETPWSHELGLAAWTSLGARLPPDLSRSLDRGFRPRSSIGWVQNSKAPLF